MAREGLIDDCGYDFCECEGDCGECGNTKCISYRKDKEEE